MEISKIINDLEDFNQFSSDNELDLILEELSKFSFEDFIYIDYVGNSKNLEIRDLFEKLVYKIDAEINEESIEKKVAIAKSLITIFQKGINEINLIYFFIFLYANSRINMPIGDLVKKYDLNENFNKILIKVFEILDNINIQVGDEVSYIIFDRNTLYDEKTLITSLSQIDFEKYNPLIKNNKFFLPNHFYQMIEVLQEYNLELFENLLSSGNIFALVLIIKCMSFNQINSFFINHDEIKEKTFLCFLIKFFSITSDDRNSYYDMIVDMCIQLYQLNKTLFKGLMNMFLYNDELFNEVLGSMFCELSNEDLNILIESIPLNDNVQLIDVRSKMLERCGEHENSNYILELIYNKWEKYLSNSFNEKERSLNILCTDFCNFIIAYYFHKYDDEELLNSMKELFIKLKNLDSDWSYNIRHHKNKFFAYYSKLFIFSVIYEFNKLDDDQIKEFYKEFYEEYVMFKKFLVNKEENFLNKFEENLVGDNGF